MYQNYHIYGKQNVVGTTHFTYFLQSHNSSEVLNGDSHCQTCKGWIQKSRFKRINTKITLMCT